MDIFHSVLDFVTFASQGNHQKVLSKLESVVAQQGEIIASLPVLTAEKEVAGASIVEDFLEQPATSKAEVEEISGKLEDREFRKKMVRAVEAKATNS